MIDVEKVRNEDVRPIKRVEYERMVECGIFSDENLELMHGMLVRMTPQSPRHSSAVSRLAQMLWKELGDRAQIFSHSPFAADDESMPEPDISVVPTVSNRTV